MSYPAQHPPCVDSSTTPAAAAGQSMSDSECPVCQLKVANLSAHLEVHSKQEVVLALLRHSININKSNVSNNILGRRNSGGSSNGGSNSSDERLISRDGNCF